MPKLTSSQQTPGCVAAATITSEFGPGSARRPPNNQGQGGSGSGTGACAGGAGRGAGSGGGGGGSSIVSSPWVTSNTTRRFVAQVSSHAGSSASASWHA